MVDATRVGVTGEAAELLRRLTQQHGPLMFHQSGGCCDGSSPMCFPDGEFITSDADIYLGDASSQVYEFLRRPRPCVFLNTHRLAWQNDPNFAHWRAGPVIDDPADLGAALAHAREDHERLYRPVQQAMFDYSFDLTEEPSSARAGRALAKFAGLTWIESLPSVGLAAASA